MPTARLDSLRAAALSAAARGWHVFPLLPGNKRPAFPDHGEDRCTRADPRCRAGHTGWEPRATTDPDRISRAWQRVPYGVGIACGPSGLVVIDLDRRKPGTVLPPAWAAEGVRDGGDVFALLCERAEHPCPHTYTVRTASGGTHLYFRHPEEGPHLRNTRGDTGRGLGPLIDTRAHGGLVVAAGSSVNGRPYTALSDGDPEPLPLWLAERLYPEPIRPAAPIVLPADRAGRYVRAAIDRTLTKLGEATEGGRNAALFMAAQSLGQLAAAGALTAEQVTDALTPAALTLGLAARETARTIRSGLSAGARHPRRVA
jgi:Bifunctional DNA primase/polymerase, N-terminal